MVSFDAETIFRHYDEVVSGGGIIYDSDLEKLKTDDVHTLDGTVQRKIAQRIRIKK